ncbi:hypothetical protein [Halodurantibacterium flavum]|uniref:Uncharacterized protein n=1 Tax=Halodurantibacterium flavum TaxID=1382802 RepID=A0ABW4SBI6_9RHOB
MERDDVSSVFTGILGAEDPWGAFIAWLGERREENRRQGGDDEVFLGVMVMQALMLNLPLGDGGRK